ncbi:metallophosphoesterase family protein [Rhizobium sp. PL01]|uniref:metallophosphoesterase family protein n=1 Tax=Rhizobium sp. PL01 TaxID=3085631 RepID=UPI00298168B9|nr:metallophosphoesterase [Rhizobium sp. PL01]MDW5312992.1 metallophosphoesterase [Rhizobium sp. PL01]
MLFLHLSDIHFKSWEVGRSTDPNRGLRDDLITDVRKMRNTIIGKPFDAILISGDIAFAGKEKEYGFALEWLRDKLCPAAGCDFLNIVVIPGNHDVDRDAAKRPVHMRSRASLRGVAVHESNRAITEFLNDEDSAQILFKPLDSYNRFAANFLCEIGFEDDKLLRKPYVSREFKLNDDSKIVVWGFNSVLVCDANDNKDLMFVDPSAAQVIERDDGTAHLVMCHHPFGWLRNGAEFRERIEEVAKIHLFGHEHNVRVEQQTNRFTRIRAGAVQPERDEPGWKPGYNAVDVSVQGTGNDRKLAVKIWVRQREQARYIAVPAFDDNPTWDSLVPLPSWVPPIEVNFSEAIEKSRLEPQVSSVSTKDWSMASDSPTIRSVAPKLLALPERDRDELIAALGLNEESDKKLRDYEAALAAIRRAADRSQLGALDQAIDTFTTSRGA